MENEYKANTKQLISILTAARDCGKLNDFHGAATAEKFLILRHDVEYSIHKALEMAHREYAIGIKRATYFIQTRCPMYNPIARENLRAIRLIMEYGYEIGLHHRMIGLTNKTNEEVIAKDAEMLGKAIGKPVQVFSVHMPDSKTKYHEMQVDGMLNAYARPFFHRFGEKGEEVKYISDSALQWNYGYPDEKTFAENEKVQLLIHPYGWNFEKLSVFETFRRLAAEAEKDAWTLFTAEHPIMREVDR